MKRTRRTPEQMIADLTKQIEQVKQRQKARELKESPGTKAVIGALKAIDRAVEAAAAEKDTALKEALLEARKPLANYLEQQGLKMPGRRRMRAKKG